MWGAANMIEPLALLVLSPDNYVNQLRFGGVSQPRLPCIRHLPGHVMFPDAQLLEVVCGVLVEFGDPRPLIDAVESDSEKEAV